MGVRDVLTDAAVRNAMVLHAAFGGSTNLLLHLPAIAFSAGLRRPTVDDWAEVNRRDSAAGGCAAQRAARVCDGAGVSGRRRAGGDAAPAPGGAAGYRASRPSAARRWARASTGGSRANGGSALRESLREQDGIDPDDVIMSPGPGALARADFDRLLSGRESGAGGLGDQEHGHRSFADRREQCVPALRAGAGVHHRRSGDSRHQGRRGCAWAMWWC